MIWQKKVYNVNRLLTKKTNIMMLNKTMRNSLLDKLKQIIKDIEIKEGVQNHYKETNNFDMLDYTYIDDFLLEAQKEIIEKALIENEINYQLKKDK